jgi:hypothetical protein
VISVLLAVPQPAAACPWYNPLCWIEEGFDFVWDEIESTLELTWNIITLDPEDAWEDFKDIAYNHICFGFTPLSLATSNGVEADFDECAGPEHPIEPEILAELGLYFESSFNTVRIHENCNLDGDVTPGSRSAITFGEHIYFAHGQYHPLNPNGSVDPEGFALLAHELTHVLQYRKKGFGDFTCEYGINCAFGANKGCAIEQDAYQYQALVFEDRSRDKDGVFTCSLDNGAKDCNKDTKFLDCNTIEFGPKPNYCKHLDNCPDDFNSGQEDSDGNMIGDICDDGTKWTAWTSEEKGPLYCGWDAGTVGFGCKGSYCDNVSLACLPVPSWTSLDYNTTYWSRFFSEEGASSGSSREHCAGIVTGIRCTGGYCDNIALECTQPQAGTLTNCWWTGWLSEEAEFDYFGVGNFITAVECKGRYCDNKRFQVCSLTP